MPRKIFRDQVCFDKRTKELALKMAYLDNINKSLFIRLLILKEAKRRGLIK